MQDTNFRKNLDFIVVIIASSFTLAFLIYWNLSNPQAVVRYDCSIAEISPDYPVAVKEQCRRLRADNILQKPK
jgi:hypothetical protein